MRFLTRSAEAGWGKAQYNLALAYQNGQLIPRDFDAARHWFQRAAACGDAEARSVAAFELIKLPLIIACEFDAPPPDLHP